MNAVSQIARGVAKDIRRFGHYRGEKVHSTKASYNIRNPQGLCCVFVNPTSETGSRVYDLNRFDRAFTMYLAEDPVVWSDRTPTEEVIKTLLTFADWAEDNPEFVLLA